MGLKITIWTSRIEGAYAVLADEKKYLTGLYSFGRHIQWIFERARIGRVSFNFSAGRIEFPGAEAIARDLGLSSPAASKMPERICEAMRTAGIESAVFTVPAEIKDLDWDTYPDRSLSCAVEYALRHLARKGLPPEGKTITADLSRRAGPDMYGYSEGHTITTSVKYQAQKTTQNQPK